MQIVSMTAEHVSRLAELEKLCFSEPWSEKSLTEEIDNPAACFLVAMQQDEVLGYGGMHTVLGESYVDNIAVFPEFRGHGVGRTLMAALIEKARENGGVFITLEVRTSRSTRQRISTTSSAQRLSRRPKYSARSSRPSASSTCSTSS